MFRFPDKPATEISADKIASMPEDYLCQLKYDGWRTVVSLMAGGCTFTSREKNRIPISDNLAVQVNHALRKLPSNTLLDAEWLKRRPSFNVENLVIFDVMILGGVPMWTQPAADRFARLRELVDENWLPTSTNGDYLAFWERYVGRPDCEGVVFKRRDSAYIGSVRACANNPAWIKCKWRHGEDGLTEKAA